MTANLRYVNGPASLEFEVVPGFFTPFRDWDYCPTAAFTAGILDVATGWCSGSPILMTPKLFVGFTRFADGVFAWDGNHTLTVSCGAGQTVAVHEGPAVYAALDAYNREVRTELNRSEPASAADPTLLSMHEYCTWVEQRYCATAGKEMQVLSHAFVERYLKRIELMGLPPGKFTIDAGWFPPSGTGTVGDWAPDPKRFPDLEATVRLMAGHGHVPGIWLGPWLVGQTSDRARRGAGLTGRTFPWLSPDVDAQSPYETLAVSEENRAEWAMVFRRYAGMGFRKFKLDIFYGLKREMQPLLRMIAEAAREGAPGCELEAHTPDVFLSQYIDAVRTNDIWIKDGKSFAYGPEHVRVCRLCSPDRFTNLDHIGGNGFLTEADYVNAHLGTFFNSPGYPVVSVLPDRFGARTVDLTRELLHHHLARRPMLEQLVREARPGIL